ncbi:tRNA lysidine(34) synthetase TilS [uncultured Gimesia sp.]|uniref:tRNA lysidine(34) synthetase TilS n=1 Tax=uncultured Gimesia sp. TaxID=1678688 RepID=UPI0030DC9A05|tara:strand:+ start:307 stop:1383 length:1077 start_codon:yes stop_codon:yes gene_type:complete
MHQFVQAVKHGLLECQQRREAEQPSPQNISPHPDSSANRTLIAVSGGADSVALMRALDQLNKSIAAPTHPESLVVAHLNHGLRGDVSDADAAWLSKECERFSLPFVTEKQELHQTRQESKEGLEELSRNARYEFLTRAAHEHGCSQIAIAHTRDDQAETVLHHLIRGTGIAGLRGIPRIRPLQEGLFLIRPMLELSRDDVLLYLKDCDQDFRTDASNTDLSFTRNRIRHQLIPLLKKEFNPNVAQAVHRLAHQADEVTAVIAEQVEQLLAAATLDQNQETWRLDCEVFQGVPDYLIRQCFLQIWQRMSWSRKRMGFDHWQRLLLLTRSGQKLSLPDQIEAERRERLLILRKLKKASRT